MKSCKDGKYLLPINDQANKMKIRDIVKKIDGKVIVGTEKLHHEVEYAFSSDLMSDVLTVDKHNILLITGLNNLQVIRTAEMLDIFYIVMARNKKISAEMCKLAGDTGMVIIESPASVFRISGELFVSGIKPLF